MIIFLYLLLSLNLDRIEEESEMPIRVIRVGICCKTSKK